MLAQNFFRLTSLSHIGNKIFPCQKYRSRQAWYSLRHERTRIASGLNLVLS